MLIKTQWVSWLPPFTQREQGQRSAADTACLGKWHCHLSAAPLVQLEKHCLYSRAKSRKVNSRTATALAFPRKGPSPTLQQSKHQPASLVVPRAATDTRETLRASLPLAAAALDSHSAALAWEAWQPGPGRWFSHCPSLPGLDSALQKQESNWELLEPRYAACLCM